MGRATQRRERRLAQDLKALAERNPSHFNRIWNLYVVGWCEEIAARTRSLNSKHRKDTRGIAVLFDVSKKAERLLAMMGPTAERQVGTHTREILNHECCKAVEALTGTHLYYPDTDSIWRLLRGEPRRERGYAAHK